MIELQQADVKYGHALALSGLTFQADQSEVIAIVGRNGAGKSTTLKAMAGLLPLAAGRRMVMGQDATGQSVERLSRLGIAMVPDTRRIFPNLSVRENLRMAGPEFAAFAKKPR